MRGWGVMFVIARRLPAAVFLNKNARRPAFLKGLSLSLTYARLLQVNTSY